MTARNAYWLSALGHIAVLGALMLVSSLGRPLRFVDGVSIVMPPPGSGPGAGREARPAPPPDPERETPTEREEAPEPPPREEEERHSQPELNVVKPPDAHGLLPLPEDDIPSERPEQRDPQPETPPALDEGVPDAPEDARGKSDGGTGGDGSVGSGSGIGIEGGVLGAHAPWYLTQLHDKIASHWRPPPVIGRAGQAEAKVRFLLQSDGSVVQVEVIASSGVRNYDMSGMRAVYNSSPLPPIPEDLEDDSFFITLIFGNRY